MEIGPAVFPGHVLALDETHFTHSLVDRAAKQVAEVCGRREGTERADNRHRLLLRSKRACRSDRALSRSMNSRRFIWTSLPSLLLKHF